MPGGPVLTYDEALEDPHVQARGMIVDLDHPIIGPMRTIAPPTRFSDLDFSVRSPAPWLGQHTASVLSEMGVDHDELDACSPTARCSTPTPICRRDARA